MKNILVLPWIDRAASGYSDRLRVTNFSDPGNTMFADIIYNAVLGSPVYFIMQSSGQKSQDEWVPVENGIPYGSNVVESPQPKQTTPPPAPKKDDDKLDDDDDDKTDDNDNDSQSQNQDQDDDSDAVGNFAKEREQSVSQNVEYQHTLKSAMEPVIIDTIAESDRGNYPDPGRCSTIAYDGKCYDKEGNLIEGLYCLQLVRPPITDQASIIATRAFDFDARLGYSLGNIMIPKPVVTGTSPDVEVKLDKDKDPNDFIKLDYDQPQGGQQPVVPNPKFMPQWDTDKLLSLLTLTAYEFIGVTRNPPVDFPELSTISQTTQSLVSNREPFVSRASLIKAQVNGVFASAGIPELAWEAMFPYTPQDIASIGDALGKGATPQVLSRYNLS